MRNQIKENITCEEHIIYKDMQENGGFFDGGGIVLVILLVIIVVGTVIERFKNNGESQN